MDHNLLRSWLGLPPGPWPPDHYTLLGFSPGRCEPAAAERTVLERMARLRSHQILHPELVTEGMNRLAQALICLTDPAARAAYDAEIGLAPAVPEPGPVRPQPPPLPTAPYEVIPGFPIPTDDEPAPLDLTQVVETQYIPESPVPGPDPPFEVVEDAEIVPPYEVVPEPVVEAEFIAPPRPPWQPKTRRQLYARLVRLRRFRDAWRKLRPYFTDLTGQLDRPTKLLAFLEAVAEIRPMLEVRPDLIGEPWRSGGVVAALLRQDLILAALRVLLPDQRQTVALDWQQGETALSQEYARLREIALSPRRYRRRFRPRGWLVQLFLWAIRNPESILLCLSGMVIGVAILRNLLGR